MVLFAISGCLASPLEESTEELTVSTSPRIPQINGSLERVFTPVGTRYLNDHTLFKHPGTGVWHLFGITDTSTGDPWSELEILHATATSPVSTTWTTQPDALTAQGTETGLWAPHVFVQPNGKYGMVLYIGNSDPMLDGLWLAESTDLNTWTRTTQRFPGGRDPFMYKLGSTWYLYSVGVTAGCQGQILVSTSTNFTTWTTPTAVITDPVASFCWGNLESPTLYRRATNEYYLFLTRSGTSPVSYNRTMVFYSNNLTSFSWVPVTQFYAHASEIVTDGTKIYLTSAGWPYNVGEEMRGFSLVEMRWVIR